MLFGLVLIYLVELGFEEVLVDNEIMKIIIVIREFIYI